MKQKKPHLGFSLWAHAPNVLAVLSIVKLFLDHEKAEEKKQQRFREALHVSS